MACQSRTSKSQVRLAFANLEATLQAGGCGLDDIVDVTTFHIDPENQFGTVMALKPRFSQKRLIQIGRRSVCIGLRGLTSRAR